MENVERIHTYNNEEVKQRTLDHYDKMIEWAEQQEGDMYEEGELGAHAKMLEALGEDWSADWCPYCQELRMDCVTCPLRGPQGCCNGTYHDMAVNYPSSWKRFAERARVVRNYIQEHA